MKGSLLEERERLRIGLVRRSSVHQSAGVPARDDPVPGDEVLHELEDQLLVRAVEVVVIVLKLARHHR
jgi:hypothetical protein